MEAETTLPTALLARLQGDPVLTAEPPGGLGFRIFNRWLVKTGPGKTDDAFDLDRGGRLRRSIVVLDAAESDTPDRQPEGTKRLFTAPTTHIFAEAHENGRLAVNQAYRRIERLLLGFEVALSPDERVGFVAGTRLFIEDSEQFPGNVVIVARWRFTGTRRLLPA